MMEPCDLVLKGGITSGVIYPELIASLADKYDFKNIGGTSAGAIAAAACAAAQYSRVNGNNNSFKTLEQLPKLLGDPVHPGGKSKLFSLFQPTLAAQQHFRVLVKALNASPRTALLTVLTGMAGMYKWLLIFGLLLGSLLLWPFVTASHSEIDYRVTAVSALAVMLLVAGFSTIAVRSSMQGQTWRVLLSAVALLLLMALGFITVNGPGVTWQLIGSAMGMTVIALLFQALLVALVVVMFARGLLAALHKNNYGLCSGKSTPDNPPQAQEGLTNWLTTYINSLAGLDTAGRPLTFGDLWGHNDEHAPRNINLEVMTTAVSQQMVYGIPFRDGTPPFYYDPKEWQELFPAQVMDYLNQLSANNQQAQGSTADQNLHVTGTTGNVLLRLPLSAELPVVVAVRMSLSFPLLLSAIPLFAIDWSLTDNAERKRDHQPIPAKRVWFSDGGIGSNMPLHMFDALLPGHPTFAINLKPEHPDYPIKQPEVPNNLGGRIYLTDNAQGGRQRFWPTPDDQSPLGGLLDFFGSMVNTMQSWRDEIMFPYPGFRDRITQISLRPDEGGLNLNMPEESILTLGNAGKMAAERLIDRFHPQGGQGGQGWQQHQQVRLKTFLGVLQPTTTKMSPSLKSGSWNAFLGGYSGAQATLATDFLLGWQKLGNLGPSSGVSLDTNAPKPLSQVRLVPKV